jgi:hypothetical protein
MTGLERVCREIVDGLATGALVPDPPLDVESQRVCREQERCAEECGRFAINSLLDCGNELALHRYLIAPGREEVLAELLRRVVARCVKECEEQAAEEENPFAQMACQACAERVKRIPL